MNLEQLQAALAAGEITQAEYDAKVAELEGKKDKGNNSQTDIKALLESDEVKSAIDKLIQSREDKIRSEYSKKVKERDAELENLKKEKLTDQERFELDKQKFEEEKREYAQKQLNSATESLVLEQGFAKELASFIPGSDLDKKQENLKLFIENIFKPAVEKAVKDKFGEQNHNFEDGKGDKPKNASQMTWDEIITLSLTNPEEANKLLAEKSKL